MCQNIFREKSSGRSSDPVLISVPALFVRGLHQDLISGKAVSKINIRVILDNNLDICRLYLLTKDKEHNYKDSIEFIGEPTDFFYLQTKEMDWTRFNAATGYKSGTSDWDTCCFEIMRKQSNT
jgi:hypothetical protein